MAVKYDEYFTKASQKFGVDKNLLIAVAKTESGIDTNAVSSAGAVGVMQLMPNTAKSLGVTNSYDAEQNIMGGAKYLSQLLTEFDGNTELALSAYNAGASRVKESGEVLSYTEDYVNKVLDNVDNTETVTSGTVTSGSTDLEWWGDLIKLIVILLLIALSVIFISVAVGKGSSIKSAAVKTVKRGGKTE